MRYLLLAPFCLAAAACSSDATTNDSQAATPATMPAGQYAIDSQVTAWRATDNQKSAVTAKVGDKASQAACVTAAAPLPAETFGGEDFQCSYKSSYMKDGMINAAIACTRKAMKGEVQMTVEGSYTATGFDAKVDSISYITGGGNYTMSRKLSGKLTGPTCAPVAAGDGADGNKAG